MLGTGVVRTQTPMDVKPVAATTLSPLYLGGGEALAPQSILFFKGRRRIGRIA